MKTIQKFKTVIIFVVVMVVLQITSYYLDRNPEFGKVNDKAFSIDKPIDEFKQDLINIAEKEGMNKHSFKQNKNGFEIVFSNNLYSNPQKFWLIKCENNNNKVDVYVKVIGRGFSRMSVSPVNNSKKLSSTLKKYFSVK